MIYFESGNQCTIAGFGKMYDTFKTNGQVTGTLPTGVQVKKYDDPDFEVARLWELKFDETYPGMPYDCRHSKYFIFL